jgi:hypothetical protein
MIPCSKHMQCYSHLISTWPRDGFSSDAVVISGAALNLLGVVSRLTKDCDILHPEIPNEIAEASRGFAI